MKTRYIANFDLVFVCLNIMVFVNFEKKFRWYLYFSITNGTGTTC